MSEFRLKVPDMSCGHCVGAIQGALEDLGGVNDFDAELDTKIVSFNSGSEITYQEVLAAVTAAGYTPERAD